MKNPFQMSKEERVVFFTRLSVPASGLLAAGKALLALLSLSFFLFINALYSLGIGLAKFLALKAHLDTKNKSLSHEEMRDTKNKFYFLTGATIIVSGAVYLIYCIRMFISKGGNTSYGTIAGITIAAFTFAELGLSCVGIKTMRRRHEPMLEAIKMTNLASALVSVVLTQTALLSLSGENTSVYNGLCGIVFGSLAAGVGILMVIRAALIERGAYARTALRRMQKRLKKWGVDEKVRFVGCEDAKSLPLTFHAAFPCEENAEAAVEKLEKKFGVRIFREGEGLSEREAVQG